MSVVAVVTCEEEAAVVALGGLRIAEAMETELLVLCVAATANEERVTLDSLTAKLPGTASSWLQAAVDALRAATVGTTAVDAAVVPTVQVQTLGPEDAPTTVLERVAKADGDYLIVGARREKGDQRSDDLAHGLFDASSVHTLMVRVASTSATRPWKRILVPTAGGPNARQALRLASKFAAEDDVTVVPLRVQPAEGELADAVGKRLLLDDLERAGVASSGPNWLPRVALGNSAETVIAEVAAEGFDLVLLGASRLGALRGQLFGAVPERQLAGVPGPAVAVVRRRWPAMDRFKARVGRWLDAFVPQLTRDDRVRLYARIESGSAWRFDFMALMGLSTAIATLGLLQSSTAVVIGAMLVAPLMTPILGAGLALVQGNLPLLRRAIVAVTLGYMLALIIGFVGAVVFPIPALTAELLARGGPTLLDLGVGFFSGVAAAYCMGRPGLVAALPGVAIAAALVPPIATIGISLALEEPANAAGAALLFGTNVVAIVLGAAMALWGCGVRRKPGPSTARRWAQLGFAFLLLNAAVLAVPLSEPLRQYRGITVAREAQLAERLARIPNVRLLRVEARRVEGRLSIRIDIEAAEPLPLVLTEELVALVRTARSDNPEVRIHTELVSVDR